MISKIHFLIAVQNERQPRNTAQVKPDSLIAYIKDGATVSVMHTNLNNNKNNSNNNGKNNIIATLLEGTMADFDLLDIPICLRREHYKHDFKPIREV